MNGTKKTEQLSESFKLLVERVKDYAIFLMDTSGNIVSWNEGLGRIKGYSAEEIVGLNMTAFYTPEDLEKGLPQRLLGIATSEGRVENEGWRLRKNGQRFWADVIITALRDESGTLVGFGKVTRDLTERKLAEERLAELSGRLVQIQDDERRRIGRELHDTTSPLLTGLTGKLYAARQRARNVNGDLGGIVDEALTLAEATATMVRTVASLLHPQLLDTSGLLPTLRWYLDTFASRTGIRVDSKLPETMARLPADREVALFRLTQEWLNSALSVGAKVIKCRMVVGRQDVELCIVAHDGDWGPEVLQQLREGTGAIGVSFAAMRERLKQLGGSLAIEYQDGAMSIDARVAVAPDASRRTGLPR